MLFLSKLLPLLIYPTGLAILFGLAALVLSLWRRRLAASRTALAIAVAVLWLSSTPLFANWLLGILEAKYPAMPVDALPDADVAILLGGVFAERIPPRVTPDAGDAIDRVLEAARIYHAGKVPTILISAGNVPWLSGPKPEADLIADQLVELGVARDAIVEEDTSENTHENAVNSALIMLARNWRTALLVTSGAHMPRALATFRTARVSATPAATDILVTYPLYQSVFDLLPDAEALARTTDAIKEYVGLLAYRFEGWA